MTINFSTVTGSGQSLYSAKLWRPAAPKVASASDDKKEGEASYVVISGVKWLTGSELVRDGDDVKSGILWEDTEFKNKQGQPVVVLKGRTVATYWPGLGAIRGILAKDSTIMEIPLQGGEQVEFDKYQIEKGTLSKNTSLTGILFKAGTKISMRWWQSFSMLEMYTRKNNAHIVAEATGTLVEDIIYNGEKFQKDHEFKFVLHSSFDEKEKHAGFLAEESRVNKINFPAGTCLYYTGTDLDSARIFQELRYGVADFPAGTTLNFDKKGHLKSAEIKAETRADRMSFQKGSTIYFYPNGFVASGWLSENYEGYKVTFLAGSEIKYDLYRRVIEGTIAKNTSLNNYLFKGGTVVRYHESGKVRVGTLAEKTEIGEVLYQAGTTISFYDDGSVESAELVVKTLVKGDQFKKDLYLKGGSTLQFYENGQLKSVFLAAVTNLNGWWYKAGESLTFYENGQVESGTLARRAVLKEPRCVIEGSVFFWPNGQVKESTVAEGTTCKERDAGTSINFRENGQLN